MPRHGFACHFMTLHAVLKRACHDNPTFRRKQMNIQGRKAIVIGGTSGIGLATSQHLAAAGASVIAASRNPEKAAEIGGEITLARCDARDPQSLQALFAAHAPFDILVNAATGGERAIGPFMDMEIDGFK